MLRQYIYKLNQVKSSEDLKETKEEEESFYTVKENYNPILNAPLTDEQKDRMNKFRNFLIQDAKNISTQDLLENIANVISNTQNDQQIEDNKDKKPQNIFNMISNSNQINNFFKENENDSTALENNRVIAGNKVNHETNDTNKKYS